MVKIEIVGALQLYRPFLSKQIKFYDYREQKKDLWYVLCLPSNHAVDNYWPNWAYCMEPHWTAQHNGQHAQLISFSYCTPARIKSNQNEMRAHTMFQCVVMPIAMTIGNKYKLGRNLALKLNGMSVGKY